MLSEKKGRDDRRPAMAELLPMRLPGAASPAPSHSQFPARPLGEMIQEPLIPDSPVLAACREKRWRLGVSRGLLPLAASLLPTCGQKREIAANLRREGGSGGREEYTTHRPTAHALPPQITRSYSLISQGVRAAHADQGSSGRGANYRPRRRRGAPPSGAS